MESVKDKVEEENKDKTGESFVQTISNKLSPEERLKRFQQAFAARGKWAKRKRETR
jgi:hypothetical protein